MEMILAKKNYFSKRQKQISQFKRILKIKKISEDFLQYKLKLNVFYTIFTFKIFLKCQKNIQKHSMQFSRTLIQDANIYYFFNIHKRTEESCVFIKKSTVVYHIVVYRYILWPGP